MKGACKRLRADLETATPTGGVVVSADDLRTLLDEYPDDEDRMEDNAKRILRARYYRSVHAMADAIREEIRAGNIADAEGAIEQIEQDTDSSYWVTYTYASEMALMCSDNSGAVADEGVETVAPWEDYGRAIAQMAYWAVRADILDRLGNLDDLFEAPESAPQYRNYHATADVDDGPTSQPEDPKEE